MRKLIRIQRRSSERADFNLRTGNKTQLYTTAHRSYFVNENLGTELGENDFLYTENVILVDKNL